MIGATVASTLARPTTRHLLVVAVAAGAWASYGNGLATGVAGALGGWLTGVGSAVEVALALVAVGAAVSGSAGRSLGRDGAWHAAGVAATTRRQVTAVAGAAVGVAGLAAFSAGAAATGLARAVVDGTSWWATAGFATGGAWDLAGLVARLVGAVGVLGALAALAGRWSSGPAGATAAALAATLPFVTVAGGAAGRTPAALAVLAATPVGALRAVALGQQGLSVPGLERRADAWSHAAVLIAWALLVVVAEPALGPHRPLARAARRRAPAAGRLRPVRPMGAGRAVLAAGALVVLTAAAAATLPERANDALPWRWQPPWRAASRAGRASDQVVAAAVRDVRSGGAGAPAIPAPVADVLRHGRDVEVAGPATMRSPEEVWVLVSLAEAVTTGDWSLEAVALRFTLAPDGAGGWAITGVDAPVAAAGVQRPAIGRTTP